MSNQSHDELKRKKTVAYIGRLSEVPYFINYFKNKNLESLLCYAENASIVKQIQKNGIPVSGIYEKEDPQSKKSAFKRSWEWAETWGIDEKEGDLTIVNDLSILKLTQYWTAPAFFHFFRVVDALVSIFSDKNIGLVILWDDEEKDPQAKPYIVDIDFFTPAFIHFASINGCETINLAKAGLNIQNISIPEQETNKTPSFLKVINRFLFNLVTKIKKVVVFVVDGSNFFYWSMIQSDHDEVSYLVEGASDLSYLGNKLMTQVTGVQKNLIYYFKNEGRCYFDFKTNWLKLSSFRSKNWSSDLNDIDYGIKKVFEKVKKYRLKNPTLIYKKLSPFDLGISFFERMFQVEIPSFMRYFLRVSEVVNKKKIKALIISNKVLPDTIVFCKAVEKKIPIIYIPHGHNHGVRSEDGDFIHPWSDLKNFPDCYSHAISGLQYNLDFAISNGLDPSKISLGGIPKFETKKSLGCLEKLKWRNRLGLPENEKILLFATSWSTLYWDKVCPPYMFDSFENIEIYRQLIDTFSNRDKNHLIFKFRPIDILIDDTKEIAIKENALNVKFFENNLEGLLIASDAVVILQSNVGLEALYYDFPIIQLDPEGKKNTLPLIPENAAIKIEKIGEAASILDKIVSDSDFREERITAQRSFLKRNLPDDEMNAAERIGKIMEGLAKKGV